MGGFRSTQVIKQRIIVMSYWKNRFYVRGYSWLGLLNTLLGCLFNRVLVQHVNDDDETIRWTWGIATDFPPMD